MGYNKNMPPQKPKIAVAQIGARRHYAIPSLLYEAGLLSCFHTDFCLNSRWNRIIASAASKISRHRGILQRIKDRKVPDVPSNTIHVYPLFTIERIWRRHLAKTPDEIIRNYAHVNQTFCRLVIGRGLGDSDTLYIFNGAGLELMRFAKKRSMKIILEQTSAPISYSEKLLQEERKQWQDWENGDNDRTGLKIMADRERAEWKLADKIFCGSRYVVDAIKAEGGPEERCKIIPYGINSDNFKAPERTQRVGKLRVLFLGTLQLGKGIPYMIEAAKVLKGSDVHIRAVGPNRLTEASLREVKKHLEYIGSVPRSDVQRHYEWADLLVLPTLSEGSANVCYEAMATGLPVITTKNSGSVVRDGLDGYIVPIRSPERIAARIRHLALNRDLISRLSANALSRSREFTWKRYAERLVAAVLS